MKLVHWVNLGLLVGVVGFAAVTWGELPERIPVHFGADGQPTRWSRPTFLSWFALPMLTVAVAVFTYAMARLLPGKPHLINMPEKEKFLALPASRRAPVVERVQEFMYWATVPTLALMGAVQWSMYRAALAGTTGRDVVVILVAGVLGGPLLMIFWSVHVQPELKRQLREHQVAESPRTD